MSTATLMPPRRSSIEPVQPPRNIGRRRPRARSEMSSKFAWIRAQIAAGMYLTPQRLDVAIDRMIDDLLRSG